MMKNASSCFSLYLQSEHPPEMSLYVVRRTGFWLRWQFLQPFLQVMMGVSMLEKDSCRKVLRPLQLLEYLLMLPSQHCIPEAWAARAEFQTTELRSRVWTWHRLGPRPSTAPAAGAAAEGRILLWLAPSLPRGTVAPKKWEVCDRVTMGGALLALLRIPYRKSIIAGLL